MGFGKECSTCTAERTHTLQGYWDMRRHGHRGMNREHHMPAIALSHCGTHLAASSFMNRWGKETEYLELGEDEMQRKPLWRNSAVYATTCICVSVVTGFIGWYAGLVLFGDGEVSVSVAKTLSVHEPNGQFSGEAFVAEGGARSGTGSEQVRDLLEERNVHSEPTQTSPTLDRPRSPNSATEKTQSAQSTSAFRASKDSDPEVITDQQMSVKLAASYKGGIVVPEAPIVASDIGSGEKMSLSDSDALPAWESPSEIEKGIEQESETKQQNRLADPAGTPKAADITATSTAATNTATETRFVIQLAAVRSADDADGERSRLEKRFADLLGNMELNVQQADVAGVSFFRIRTHPIQSRTAASKICSQLKGEGQDCIVLLHASKTKP